MGDEPSFESPEPHSPEPEPVSESGSSTSGSSETSGEETAPTRPEAEPSAETDAGKVEPIEPAHAHGEWRSDPTGRHEGRYFVAGHPTDLVRDGSDEFVDPEGEHELLAEHPARETAAAAEATTQTGESLGVATEATSRRRRGLWIAIGAGAVVIAVVVAVVALTSGGTDTDTAYVAALRKADALGQFPNNASAIAHAKSVCRKLEAGAAAQGTKADSIGVRSYCNKYADGFHVLERVTIKGSFVLKDSSPNTYYPSITSTGVACQGSNGYSDIGPGTTVTVKDENGKLLTQTGLGAGTGSSSLCIFGFSFDVTEGSKQYIVTVSHRGELSFTFAQLKNQGVDLSLGS